jgi:hypothetical protein
MNAIKWGKVVQILNNFLKGRGVGVSIAVDAAMLLGVL